MAAIAVDSTQWLRKVISSHAEVLKGAKALIDGNLGDVISSLHSRLDIICDEVDGQLDSVADVGGDLGKEASTTQIPISQLQLQLLRKQCSLSFPQRVFVPCTMIHTYATTYNLLKHLSSAHGSRYFAARHLRRWKPPATSRRRRSSSTPRHR